MSATRPPAFDDRFSTPIEASRRGAHRARPKPASAGLPVLAGLAVILLVLGGGYVVLRGGNSVSNSSSNLAAASAADSDPNATPSAGGEATSAPAAAEDGEPEADEPEADEPANPGPKVNRDIRFKLLNSTSISGLAKRVEAKIEDEGWEVAEEDLGNSRNRGLTVTKIYYGKASTKATAQALKKDLGYGTVVLDASALTGSDLTTADLAVVLGTDAG